MKIHSKAIRRGLVLWLFCCSLISLDEATAKDDFMDMYAATVIGQSLGENLAGAIEAAAGMPKAAAEADQEIQEARTRYWATYPDKPGFPEADAAFAAKLAAKDVWSLYLQLINESSEVQQRKQGRPGLMGIGDLVNKMQGRIIDGGIPCSALSSFDSWYRAVEGRLSGTVTNLSHISQLLQKAVAQSSAAYENYKIARDWAEFDRAGRLPAWVKTPRGYVHMMLMRYAQLDPKEVSARYKELIEVFGEEHVHATAEKVRRAKLGDCGHVADVAALGLVKRKLTSTTTKTADGREEPVYTSVPSSYAWVESDHVIDVYYALLTTGSVDRYILGAQRVGFHLFRDFGKTVPVPWREYNRKLQLLKVAYGDTVVSDIGTRVQQTNFSQEYGYILDGAKIGLGSGHPFSTMEKLLAHQDPQGFVKLLFLSSDEDADRGAQIYDASVKAYGVNRLRTLAKPLVDKVFPRKAVSHEEREICPADALRLISPRGNENAYRLRLLIEALWMTSTTSAESGISRPILFENPGYKAWTQFANGAEVVYVNSGSYCPDVGDPASCQKSLLGGEVTYRLDSVTLDKVVVTTTGSLCPGCTAGRVEFKHFAGKSEAESLQPWFLADKHYEYLGYKGVEPIANEVLELGSLKVLATRYKVEIQKEDTVEKYALIWVADQIPGGIAKTEHVELHTMQTNYGGVRKAYTSKQSSLSRVTSYSGKLVDRNIEQGAPRETPQTQASRESFPTLVCNFYR